MDVSKIKLGEESYDIKDANIPAWARASTKPTYTANEVGALPSSTTIPSASSTTPTMDGVGAIGSSTNYARADHVHPSDTSRVPTTRTINNKALSSDITLTASDVGALPSTTTIPDLSDVKFIVGVTITDNVISNPTKTFSEISTAYNAGKLVIVRDNSGYEYYCEYCDSSNAYFFSADTLNVYYVGVTSLNAWTFSYVNLDTSNLLNSINNKPDVVYMLNNGSTWNQTSYNSGTNSWSVSNTALTGNVKNIYIDKANNEGYYWNPSTSQFVKIGPTIYSWALASTKPTYTASEVGAMATTHPANAITSTDIENWDGKADKIIVSRDVSSSGSISRTILPGKFYIFPTLTGLTLTLGTGQGFLIYGGKFTADSSGCTLTLPSGTTVAPGCPSIEGGNTYEFNILDGSLILALI